ncbi:MAG: response regulator, partial [Oscillospiraceae bacterium]
MNDTKILIVDDEKNICELLRLYFEKEGFVVLMAHDGEQAVDVVKKSNPALVMLDIMMPKIDGWEACRQIREFSKVPIIMLTAKGETFDKVMGLDSGADDYVTKP